MTEIHTHVFVGGPKDGQRELMQGADIERGRVTVRAATKPSFREPDPDIPAAAVVMADTAYERTAYEGEKARFIFWKATGLTIDDAIKLLFEHYINR